MKKLIFFLTVLLLPQFVNGQGDLFLTKHLLPPPANDPGGWGNLVSNIDIDNDGRIDLFLVNRNSYNNPDERIPRIYKFEWNDTTWELVWTAELSALRQADFPPLTSGDWDGDGKMEIIWGPVNNFVSGASTNPPRVIVFESKGDGSDIMGIPISGTSNFRPNAAWTITQTPNLDIRPFMWKLADVDDDSKQELVFAEYGSNLRFGIISVSDIPDNGNGSETWTLETSGTGLTSLFPASLTDFAILGTRIFFICEDGTFVPVCWNGTTYSAGTPQKVLLAGSRRNASVVDLDNNGTFEIVAADGGLGSNMGRVFLLRLSGDTLSSAQIADIHLLISATPVGGGEAGDVDGDGKYDFIFANSRSPDKLIRVKYLGGNISSASSYEANRIQRNLTPLTSTFDFIGLANIDNEPGLEILFSRTLQDFNFDNLPMVTLKCYKTESIADVKIDNDNNLQPDRLNEVVRVKGVINSINLGVSDNNFRYSIQDATGGIVIIKENETGGGPLLNIGDQLIAKGNITQVRGTVQLELNSTRDVVKTDTVVNLTPITLSVPNYLQNGYKYQSTLIEIPSMYKDPMISVPWPPINTDADFGVWDYLGNRLTLRIDKDTDIDGKPEPSWPTKIRGVASQYTSGINVFNDGYQITPMSYDNVTLYGPSSITLLSPNGGELWPVYTTQKIRWTSQYVNNVKIVYKRMGTYYGDTIVVSTPAGLGEYTFRVPYHYIFTTCKVKISDVSNASVFDTTDGFFTISGMSPSLGLISPNGGETFRAGYPHSIRWLETQVDSVKLEYTSDNGATWNLIYPNVNANSGTYQWMVPNINSSECRVRLSNTANPSLYVVSDTLFTIAPFQISLTCGEFNQSPPVPLPIQNWPFGRFNFNAETTGSMLKSVKITLSGTYTGLSGDAPFRLYIGSSYDFSSATPIGTDRVSVNEVLYFDSLNIPLPAGETFFWITADVAIGAGGWIRGTISGSPDITVSGNQALYATYGYLDGGSYYYLPVEVDFNPVYMFALEQNYPNPFNPVTTIIYSIPTDIESNSIASLRIYDLLGNEVALLVNEEKQPGRYEIKFDASNLSSGVYFYRLHAGTFTGTKKLILIK